ncbi:MAG: hypothetical protein ACK58L_01995 [Planctomycetota bacterium]
MRKHSSLLWAAVMLCLPVLAGCQHETPAEKATGKQEKPDLSVAEECQRKLGTAIARMYPDSMATQTRRDTVVNGLNAWLSSCGAKESPKISDANGALMSPTALRTAGSVRFTENDVVYIRDCLLLKSLTESIWKQADQAINTTAAQNLQATNRDRVVLLFRHLMRNISLLNDDEQRVPLGLYEVLMTGRGTVDDRVWAFGESLRQRQLDCVILRASGGDAASDEIVQAADLLLAVVDGKDVMLFDPVRATAVPQAGDSSPLVLQPAGLDAISGDDRWKAAKVEIICHPSGYAPRMIGLQSQLDARDSAVLYEELAGGTSAIRPLRERLNDALGSVWKQDSFQVWSYPETRVAESAALDEGQKQELSKLMKPFDSPFERESVDLEDIISDPTQNVEQLTEEEKKEMWNNALNEFLNRSNERSDVLFGKPSGRLRSTRLEQVMGNVELAMIQELQQIRIANLQEKLTWLQSNGQPISLPRAMLEVQRAAVSDSLFWTSMCQIARNDFGAALATLRNYRSQYPEGKMFLPSMLSEAEVLMAMNEPAAAAEVLAKADVDGNPQRIEAKWRLSRLAPR